jgi:putative alpha-1,2-mannosidase
MSEAPHPNQQVSRTLEYAYDDYVIAQLALLLDERSDYDILLNHSNNFANLIDGEGVNFVRPKYENGSWAEDESSFDPTYKYKWLTESSPWQYTW